MPSGHHELVAEAQAVYQSLLHAIQEEAIPAWLALDITMAQLKVLLVLVYDRPATIGRIAERLGIGLPTASHLTERLVQAGLVERIVDPIDRRRAMTRLSAQGDALIARLRQGRQELTNHYFSQLTDQELSALIQGLRGLARVVHAAELSDATAQADRG